MSWWDKLTTKTRGVFGSAAAPRGSGCDHGAITLRQETAEFEWFVARGELEVTKDLRHGAGHLANLLTYDPGEPEWVELLEQYLAAAGPDPESLIPRGDKLFYGTEAVRAYIWQKQGRLADAVDLLVQVTNAKPDSRYLEAWALGWLEPPGAIEGLSEELGLRLFGTVLNRFQEARRLPLPRLRGMQRWAALSDRFSRVRPPKGVAVMLRAGILRKAGRFDDAAAVVQAALDRAPDWHSATALGLILREKGDIPGAEDAFRAALRLDSTDVSAMLEAGDMRLDHGDFQSALRWYEDALRKEPKHPWAKPSALFCRWKLSGDERHIRDLIAAARSGNDRADALCRREFWPGLPEPADATANMLRQFRESILNDPAAAPVGEVQISLTSLEAPSNYLAVRLEMEALRHDLRMSVTVNEVPKPDPRLPVEEVRFQLWRYDGTDAAPGLPPPGADVLARVAELAAAPHDEDENWAAASVAAEEIGPGRVGEVLACIVHPPVPEGTPALVWLPRVQLAAAQVAGQVDSGWEGSVRREALMSVLHGPQDWATEAAIRVLTRIGRENEAYAPDIHDAFQVLADNRPDGGYWGWVRTLFSHWQALPHLYPDERKALEQVVADLDARDEPDEDEADEGG
jgi:tetratricopeptide (TPR) repeat protein